MVTLLSIAIDIMKCSLNDIFGHLLMDEHRNSHGKRRSDYANNKRRKRRNVGADKYPSAPAADDTVYRYLCPLRKIGIIIGLGGEVIKQIREDSQAKIMISEIVHDCKERIITIFSRGRETNMFEDTGHRVCPAQDALFMVHEKLFAYELPVDKVTTVRLLVPSDQIRCITGIGGNNTIQGICTDTGAQVRILKEELPACANSSDVLLEIIGEASIVKKALFQVSSCLHDNPSRSLHFLTSNKPQMYPPGAQIGIPNFSAASMGMYPIISPYGGYKGDAAGNWPSFHPPPRDVHIPKKFSLHLLCSPAKIGRVIGQGGAIINRIRQESRAFIKLNTRTAKDDCIISIYAAEFFEEPISPAIDAAVRLQPICSDHTGGNSGDPSYTTRLLVPKSRIRRLIGKNGSIMDKMMRTTRANIQIVTRKNVREVASHNEMVQITGGLDVAKSALVQITTRLRAEFFGRENARSSFPSSVPHHPLPSNASDNSRDGGGSIYGPYGEFSAHSGSSEL
ncbi:KH domain-containing protein At4g18375-like [Typha angustifolia]|uniref:KH domain-containing protein At4g18375-like n=1 Tax=Typha angustifolia TaxID=59011 RepID=UPI003C2B49A5